MQQLVVLPYCHGIVVACSEAGDEEVDPALVEYLRAQEVEQEALRAIHAQARQVRGRGGRVQCVGEGVRGRWGRRR